MASDYIGEDFVHALHEVTAEMWEWNADHETNRAIEGLLRLEFDEREFQGYWINAGDLEEECKRVFFRLTGKPDGMLVPLWDLLDEWPMGGKEVAKANAYDVIRVVFALTCKRATPPVRYDPVNAVFTKDMETFDAIAQLNRFYVEEWGKKGEKKE
jgi:hypothetical protein